MVTDSKKKANMLLAQHNSVASRPKKEFIMTNGGEFLLASPALKPEDGATPGMEEEEASPTLEPGGEIPLGPLG